MKTFIENCEFTWDMVRGLPKSYYCYKNNIPHTVMHKPGLEKLYSFRSINTKISKFEQINDATTYLFEGPEWINTGWSPPPLKQMYKGKLKLDKPSIVIQNKHTTEWGTGPYNYFSVEFLDNLFSHFKDKYTVIYIRPEGQDKGYYVDHNHFVTFDDYKLIEDKHPEIFLFNDYVKKFSDIDYNTLQFIVEATSEKHITVSGGNACVAAYFGGDVIIYDSPQGAGAGRGIWKTDSWLNKLSGAKIHGYNEYNLLLDKVKKLW